MLKPVGLLFLPILCDSLDFWPLPRFLFLRQGPAPPHPALSRFACPLIFDTRTSSCLIVAPAHVVTGTLRPPQGTCTRAGGS
ncbi:hypothetical protein J3F84DRAFT_363723 [Trichoderma pleuroticola]